MIEDNTIIDTPLPAAQNFHFLKAEGIDLIQLLVGESWTNFNDSDPGVTILDQLCYALTELGYCNDFDIADILTGVNGQINYQNQFFLPQDILTCGPVTTLDMRKLLLDGMPALANVYIDPLAPKDLRLDKIGLHGLLGIYQVYLYIDDAYLQGQVSASMQAPIAGFPVKEGQSSAAQLAQQAFELLNRHRNLGEWFLPVVTLTTQSIVLNGEITVTSNSSKVVVRGLIQQALADYISPAICRYGYQQMVDMGQSSEDIFNGPKMNNGWILDADLSTPKRKWVKLNDIKAIISAIDGVSSVDELSFASASASKKDSQHIKILDSQVAAIDSQSLVISGQSIQGFDLTQKLNDELSQMGQLQMQSAVQASVDIAPKPPTGLYRDIESYYAVQNTFPEEYGIGFAGLPTNSSDYRQAQAKQLKGYLTIFDQMLANQFSQLAHVGDLFSFVGTSTIAIGTATKTGIYRTPETKPYAGIPYQLFPPTYFCQDVYSIPEIQPLLKGNQMYRFGPDPITTLAQEQQIWLQYQQNPFNQYMYGLRQNMENDHQRDDRRSRMLDHLLARHGADAKQIDTVLTQARWYGSTTKTRIIIKSILLQNYQSLSYNRAKAYSTLFAERLGNPGRYRLTTKGFEHLPDYDISSVWLNQFVDYGWHDCKAIVQTIMRVPKIAKVMDSWSDTKIEQFVSQCLVFVDSYEQASLFNGGLYRDGQLDMEKLSAQEQLTSEDFNSFASPHLTINLLLGLSQYYQTIVEILVILIKSDSFIQWLNGDIHSPQTADHFELLDSNVTINVYRQSLRDGFIDTVAFNTEALIEISSGRNQPSANGQKLYGQYIDQLQWLASSTKGLLLLEPILWLDGIDTQGEMNTMPYTPEYYALLTLVLVPGYVVQLRKESSPLRTHLEQLIATLWPAHIQNHLILLTQEKFADVIKYHMRWHNIMRKGKSKDRLRENARQLAKALLPIIYGPPTTDLTQLASALPSGGDSDNRDAHLAVDAPSSEAGGKDDS